MSNRGKYLPDKDAGKNWGNFGVVCLICGLHFYGGVDKATRECANHTTAEHPGQVARYAAFATPLSYEAEKKARFLTGTRDAVGLERVLREHGGGWYLYALHYGVAEADDHIRAVLETEGEKPKTLREMVQNGQDA